MTHDRVGDYALLTALDQFDEVTRYAGQHVFTKRPVVVSLMPPQKLDALYLFPQHPNLPTILSYGQADGLAYIVTPALPAKPLSAEIAEGRSLVQLASALTSAIDYWNAKGKKFGSIQREQVLQGSNGHVWLDAYVLNKPSPEDDVYHVGELLYTVIAGQTAGVEITLSAWQQHRIPLQIAGWHDAVADVIGRATHPDPQARYTTGRDLLADLRGALAMPAPPPMRQDHQLVTKTQWSLAPQLPLPQAQYAFPNAEVSIGGAFLPDGESFIAASADGNIYRWQVGDDSPIFLAKTPSALMDFALSGDGKLFATAHDDGSARVWTTDGDLSHELWMHDGAVLGCALSGRGDILATCGADGLLRLWDLAADALLHVLQWHEGAITCCDLSASGELVLTGGDDGRVVLASVQQGEVLARFEEHRAAVSACYLRGELIFSGDVHGGLVISDIMMQDPPMTLWGNLQGLPVTDCHLFARAEQPLGLSVCADGTVRLWDVHHGVMLTEWQQPQGLGSTWGALSRFHYVIGTQAADLYLERHTIPHIEREAYHNSPIRSAVTDGATLMSIAADEFRAIEIGKQKPQAQHTQDNKPLVMACNEQYLFMGTGDGILACYDRRSMRLRWDAAAHKGSLLTIGVLNDKRLITVGTDGIAALWNVMNGARLSAVATQYDDLLAATLWGEHLAIASGGGVVSVWDVLIGQQLLELPPMAAVPQSIAPLDERRLLVGDSLGALWELSSDHAPQALQIGAAGVAGLAPHTDGDTVLAWFSDGDLGLYSWSRALCWGQWQMPSPVRVGLWYGNDSVLLGDENGDWHQVGLRL